MNIGHLIFCQHRTVSLLTLPLVSIAIEKEFCYGVMNSAMDALRQWYDGQPTSLVVATASMGIVVAIYIP